MKRERSFGGTKEKQRRWARSVFVTSLSNNFYHSWESESDIPFVVVADMAFCLPSAVWGQRPWRRVSLFTELLQMYKMKTSEISRGEKNKIKTPNPWAVIGFVCFPTIGIKHFYPAPTVVKTWKTPRQTLLAIFLVDPLGGRSRFKPVTSMGAFLSSKSGEKGTFDTRIATKANNSSWCDLFT